MGEVGREGSDGWVVTTVSRYVVTGSLAVCSVVDLTATVSL